MAGCVSPRAGLPTAACWDLLPVDCLLQVEAQLAAQNEGSHLAAMRAVCTQWRHALASAPSRLQPLGKPARWEAFPRAVALDYARRGGGQALTDGELSAAAGLLGSRLQQLDLGGAFQLTAEGVHGALRACTALRSLAADGSTLQDAAFSGLAPPSGGGSGDSEGADHTAAASGSSGSVSSGSKGPSAMVVCGDGDGCGSPTAWTLRSHPAPPLHRLEQLSLRGCMFLRGGLLADLAACPHLSSLDLAGCSLALNLNHNVSALLGRLASLQRLVLDGNQADDVTLRHVAGLPHLRELSVQRSEHITDGGLHHLARRRGSTALPRSGSLDAAGAPLGAAAAAGEVRDVGLLSLDISGCSGLTDQFWLALTQMQGLTSLRLEHMAPLLQFPSMPEQLPAALWRLPRLRLLSLAGSCCHPSKLKLLAATCGGSITHLDLSTGGAAHCAACTCCGSGAGGSGRLVLPADRVAAGPPYRRLTSLHERDLCEAAQSFRQLRCFRAAGSALPLRVAITFLGAAPEGRLEHADLSGCCLEAEACTAAAGGQQPAPWQRQLFFSSGARRTLTFDELPAVTGNSVSRLQQLHAEAESWQRPATAGRFAAALRRQGASLRVLRLGGASGLGDRHLSSLRALRALECLCLAGTRATVSATLLADAGCPALRRLDISGTSADDACLAAAAAMPRLQHLAAAGCDSVGAAGAVALAAGPAAASLRTLDLSHTSCDDAAVAALAAACSKLRSLRLTGCHALTPAAARALCRLRRLNELALGRCPAAVTDESLQQLAAHLPLLTHLNVSEAARLTPAGLSAALPLLPVLAQLDLTACSQLRDEQTLQILSSGSAPGASSDGSTGGGGGGHATPANVALPQGGTSPTGSPFRRRSAGA